MSLFKVTPSSEQLSEAEKLAWLQLSRTDQVGPMTFYRLIEQTGSAIKALEMLPEISRRGGRKTPLTPASRGEIEREYAALKRLGGKIITAAEDTYPLALSACDDAPPVLSILGDPALFNRNCIAIVGARNASLNGRKCAEKLAADLGKAEQIIVSGLARGIDTAAHKGALSTGTIAVVAGGIDVVYPEENQGLYEEIKARGLIVAESPLGQKPFAQSFPRRNRIVSGLSQGVVVIEATMRSGSLITARLAGEQGRDVYAVPGHPFDPRASGPNHLIREGATLVRDAKDILEGLLDFSGKRRETLTTPPRHLAEPPSQPFLVENDLPPEAQDVVLAALSFTPSLVDEVMAETGLGVGALQTVLLELELGGRIKRLPGGRVVLNG